MTLKRKHGAARRISTAMAEEEKPQQKSRSGKSGKSNWPKRATVTATEASPSGADRPTPKKKTEKAKNALDGDEPEMKTTWTQTPVWARELLPCNDDDINVYALESWSTDREGWGNYYKMVDMDKDMVCDDGRGLKLG